MHCVIVSDFLRMMKNLGDKLLKARTDMGISVRDAAVATKLRIDVIEKMESGSFNIKLAEIYKRGFLHIYATFLKLDADSIMEEYTLASSTASEASKRRVLAGKVAQQQDEVAANQPQFQTPNTSTESRFGDSDDDEKETSAMDFSTKKMAVVMGGVLLAVVFIILIVSSLVGKDVPEENQDVAMNVDVSTPTTSVQTGGTSGLNEVPAQDLTLVLTALADTYVLVYPDVKTPDGKPSEVFFTGAMQAGERKEFRSKVPIMVRLTDAERIKIERNGKALDTKGAKGLQLFRIVSK